MAIETRPNGQPGAWLTPEQWVEWFVRCTPEERLEVAGIVLRDAQVAQGCFLADHSGQIEHLNRALYEATQRASVQKQADR